jgi:RNA polymerase sigma-70 factor (family 1)
MRAAFTVHVTDANAVPQPGIHPDTSKEPEPIIQPEGETLPDTELFIRRTFDTDPQKGCELLFRLYYRPMCTHAVRFVYSKEIAEDLVADVFYTFWNTQAYSSVNRSFRAFLFRSVRNRAYNYLANEFKKSDSLDSAEQQETAQSNGPESIMRYNELYQKVDELVAGLPPQCRNAFILNRFEGKRAKEIAQEMQLSVRTVEVHIAKALSTLRDGLRNQWLTIALILGLTTRLDFLF